MNPLAELVAQLTAAGVPVEQIPDVIARLGQETERRRQRATNAGFSEGYLNALSGPQLFSSNFDNTLSLLTGQNEIDREQQLLDQAANAQQSRVGTGLSVLDFVDKMAQQRAAAEADPFRTVEYLAGLSGLPEGSGTPLQSLIGEGFTIKPQLPPLYDDRFNETLDRLYDFGRPRTPAENVRESRQNQVEAAYARDPEAAERFFRQRPEDLQRMFGPRPDTMSAFARGGRLTTDEPMVGMGLLSRRPRFIVGEQGPERMDIRPMTPPTGGVSQTRSLSSIQGPLRRQEPTVLDWMRAARSGNVLNLSQLALRNYYARQRPEGVMTFATGGTVYTGKNPYGEERKDLTGPLRTSGPSKRGYDPFRKGGAGDIGLKIRAGRRIGLPKRGGSVGGGGGRTPTGSAVRAPSPQAPASGAVSPAQAAAISLGKALKPNPFAHLDMIDALLQGRAPTPGSFTQRFARNADPALLAVLQSVIRGFGLPWESYLHDAAQFTVPGLPVSSVRYA